MSEVVCNTSGIISRIDQLGERAVKHVHEVMETYAEVIAKEMELYAPRDTGALENAIEVVSKRDGINRRWSYTIQVNPNAVNEDGRNVATYAEIMDAFLIPHGEGGFYAREGTLAKGAQAGGKFVERAVQKYEKQMIEHVRAMVKRIL